ncbi:MAG: bifunctional riboflavin kinase/FAD synthetase [Actinomycetota bacterium]
MKFARSLSELDRSPNRAVAIGKFDCLHLGHQQLLKTLNQVAQDKKLVSTALTFDRHPDSLLRPDQLKLAILGENQKREVLAEAGIEEMVELEFTAELAGLTPAEFVKKYLVDGLRAAVVVVGEGFRFGNQGAGDCSLLRDLGAKYDFEVIELAPVMFEGKVVSTTWIRELLDCGDVAKVNALIGRTHEVTGVVEHGLKIGRKIGFPTANIARDAEGYLPLDGVYAGWLVAGGNRYPAAHSVGINETFQAVPRLVESHVLDERELDLYDQVVTLEFVDFLRPAAKFDGVEALVAQINLDLEQVREKLGLK